MSRPPVEPEEEPLAPLDDSPPVEPDDPLDDASPDVEPDEEAPEEPLVVEPEEPEEQDDPEVPAEAGTTLIVLAIVKTPAVTAAARAVRLLRFIPAPL